MGRGLARRARGQLCGHRCPRRGGRTSGRNGGAVPPSTASSAPTTAASRRATGAVRGAREPRRGPLHPGLRLPHLDRRRPHREEAALPLPARARSASPSPPWAATSPAASARTPTSARCRATRAGSGAADVGRAGGRRGRWPRAAAASPTPTPSRPSSSSTPATAPGWRIGRRPQERVRHQRLHDPGDAGPTSTATCMPPTSISSRSPTSSTATLVGARLKPVLDSIRRLLEHGRLGGGDHAAHPRARTTARTSCAGWPRSLPPTRPDIPWHVSRFHPTYRMLDVPPTPRLVGGAGPRGRAGGGTALRVRGQHPRARLESTRCPSCGQVVIERRGFAVVGRRLEAGRCAACGTSIPLILPEV